MSKAQRATAVEISPGDDGLQRSSFGALARSLLIGHIAFLTRRSLRHASHTSPCSRMPMVLRPSRWDWQLMRAPSAWSFRGDFGVYRRYSSIWT
jgi:hypothetical protein